MRQTIKPMLGGCECGGDLHWVDTIYGAPKMSGECSECEIETGANHEPNFENESSLGVKHGQRCGCRDCRNAAVEYWANNRREQEKEAKAGHE